MADRDGLVIDLNADLGEGGEWDEALFAAGISSANVACGAHAGDGATMAAACALAARHGVALGAHPGHADREGFGRRELVLGHEEARDLLAGQFGALAEAASGAGAVVWHVKPHGALYHQANREAWLAELLVAEARRRWDGVRIFGPPSGCLREAAERVGAAFVPEGFVDRAYRFDGSLVPRGEPGAVLHEEGAAVAQALGLAQSGRVHTLCVHGDGPEAARLLGAARAALVAAGFRIAPPRA
jgi:5-oxoprolinase (ATP-hydrolysing) subunit A